MSQTRKQLLIDPLVDNNPITLQVLGICSALAVTVKMDVTLIMCIALTSVITLSNFFISSRTNDGQLSSSHDRRLLSSLTIVSHV